MDSQTDTVMNNMEVLQEHVKKLPLSDVQRKLFCDTCHAMFLCNHSEVCRLIREADTKDILAVQPHLPRQITDPYLDKLSSSEQYMLAGLLTSKGVKEWLTKAPETFSQKVSRVTKTFTLVLVTLYPFTYSDHTELLATPLSSCFNILFSSMFCCMGAGMIMNTFSYSEYILPWFVLASGGYYLNNQYPQLMTYAMNYWNR